MDYISTRGFGPVSFDQMMMHPCPPDGGLYMPAQYPRLSMEILEGFAYQPAEEIIERVLSQFIPGGLPLKRAIAKTAQAFADSDLVPMLQYSGTIWLQEMYYGPTLSALDLPMQLMAELMPLADQKQTLVLATQGDSGAAAVEAFKNHDAFNVVVVFPKNRISAVSEQQICASGASNVYPIALDGGFDICQQQVRAVLSDNRLVKQLSLNTVNSLTWLRVLIQSVPFFIAWARLGELRPVSFALPTGNFTAAMAGYVALQCGLPIHKIIPVSPAENDIYQLLREGHTDDAVRREIISMPHAQVGFPTNIERLLFDVLGRDARKLRSVMQTWRRTGQLPQLDLLSLHELHGIFAAEVVSEIEMMCALSEADALAEIVLDPHSAMGLAAAQKHARGTETVISLCPTSAVKFPHVVKNATSKEMLVEEEIDALMAKEKVFHALGDGSLRDFLIDRFMVA